MKILKSIFLLLFGVFVPQQLMADADLVTTYTVSPTTAAVGDEVTYTLAITNNGPEEATNVAAVYTLSESIENLTITPSQGTREITSTGNQWNVGSIANGDTVTITSKGTVGDGMRGATLSDMWIYSDVDQNDPTEDGDVYAVELSVNPIPVVGSCTSGFDWDNSGWEAGKLAQSITLSNGITADINVSTDTAGSFTLNSPFIDNHYLGGVPELGISFDPDANTGTSPVIITVTFSEPVYNGSFLLTDIDASGTDRDDRVTVTSDAGDATLTVLGTNEPTVTVTAANVAESTEDLSSTNGNRGTVRITIPDGATKLTMVYEEANTVVDDHPARAAGFLGNFSVCAKDTDGDGIPNDIDLDDDNDGILDVNEGFSSMPSEKNRVVFILDTSGSVSSSEYSEWSDSINTLSTQLLSNNPEVEIAIVQYGSQSYAPSTAAANISREFSNTHPNWATNKRDSTLGSSDHLPASMVHMRDFWKRNGTLDLTLNSNNTIVIFTDATKTSSGASLLENSGVKQDLDALEGYGEYDFLKKTYNAKVIMVHASEASLNGYEAATAISSKDINGDSLAQLGTFSLTTEQINSISNGVELIQFLDSDLDNIPNYLDLDSDNDGIPDNVEAQTTAGYTAPTGTVDANGTWSVVYGVNGITPVDTDEDNVTDTLDLDSDNDGKDDRTEAGYTLATNTNDSDNDGILDAYDDVNGFDINDELNSGASTLPNEDKISDDDNEVDYRDIDADFATTNSTEDNVTAVSGNEVVIDVLANDTDPENDMNASSVKIIDPATNNPVTELVIPNEGTWTVDPTTGKITFTPVSGFIGNPSPISYVVSDNTGNTSDPVAINIAISLDSDGDGIPDDVDLDDDNDGILDTVEELTATNGGDTDGDGIPDRLDLDSDNDGILDILESGQDVVTLDTNHDGVLDSIIDTDKDGVMYTADTDDADANSEGTVSPIDTDGDGKPDFQDVDSDNDGLSDLIEAVIPATNDEDNDGMIDNPVVDANGVPTVVGSVTTPVDTDGDGIANYRDLDSDNDGLNDIDEVDGLDENHDGIVDVEDLVDGSILPDIDGNNIPDVLEANNPNLPVAVDANGDGVIDVVTDTDGDGIPDVTDGQITNFGTGTAIDTDGDGIADVYDIDDDNDGIPDVVEAKGNPTRDTDGDGIIDSLDLDADNDGILDIVEAGGVDSNNDGRVDPSTGLGKVEDSDRDGLADVVDVASTTANNPTNENEGRLATLLLIPDTDTDSKADFQDVDSDNDGLPDYREVPEVIAPTPTPVTPKPTPVAEEEALVEDRVVSDLAQPVTVKVLENDRANVNSTTVKIELPVGFMEANPNAELSEDGKSLIIPNQGTWTVNSDGTITYRSEFGTEIVNPTPISYSVETTEGKRLETDTQIILSQSVVGEATDTNTTADCVCEDNVSIYSNGTMLLVILLGSLFGVFLFRQER